MAKPLVIKSPLKAWPGKIELPDPNDFSGVHWQTWKASVNKAKRKRYALTHLYCYAGLELIQVAGEWALETPIEEVQAWETEPEEERVKLVAWLGRTVMGYIDGIMDPKD
jgi:hypothetical protein